MKSSIKTKLALCACTLAVASFPVMPVFAATSAGVTSTTVKVSSSAQAQPNNVITSVAKKALILLLRKGGPALGNAIAGLSPDVGAWITLRAWDIADLLERLDTIQELPVATGLISMGIPPRDAWQIAQWIVWFLSI